MSFSKDVKDELSRQISSARHCLIAETAAVIRQVMMEFCNYETFEIILGKSEEEYKSYTLEQLLPMGFGPSNLNIK